MHFIDKIHFPRTRNGKVGTDQSEKRVSRPLNRKVNTGKKAARKKEEKEEKRRKSRFILNAFLRRFLGILAMNYQAKGIPFSGP